MSPPWQVDIEAKQNVTSTCNASGGVMITTKLTWETQVLMVTATANNYRLLGLLSGTCPMLTDVKVRRSLYLALVKSQISYATQVCSPSYSTLKQKAEIVQRRATRWILTDPSGSATAYLWPRGQGFSISLFKNYSPKAKLILLNNPWDEVD